MSIADVDLIDLPTGAVPPPDYARLTEGAVKFAVVPTPDGKFATWGPGGGLRVLENLAEVLASMEEDLHITLGAGGGEQ